MTVNLQTPVYAIPGNETGGRIFIYDGVAQSTDSRDRPSERRTEIKKTPLRLLFFCGGYPDDCSSFLSLAERFAQENNIICGATCLPGYDTHHSDFKEEYSFDEMVLSLKEACKCMVALVMEFHSVPQTEIDLTGVFHDWGSYVGAMLVNRMNLETPEFFHKVVFLDVLPPLHSSLKIPRQRKPLSQALVIVTYTGLFAFCHAIQRFISFWVAAPIQCIGFSLLTILGFSPIRLIDNKTFMKYRPKEYTLRKLISMQYPYYNVWSGILSRGPKDFLKNVLGDATLPANVLSPSKG